MLESARAILNRIRKKVTGALSRSQYPPSVGRVQFGSFRHLNPISRKFGYDRGMPIDRYYIEAFLNRNRYDIKGRVLEIRDSTYTRRFGDSCVTVSEVLDIDAKNPKATLIADLAAAADVPSDLFDCIICTQTLQMIYDVRSAVSHLHRMLRPGGVLLVTTHGMSMLDSGQSYHEYWRFTAASASKLFAEFFPTENVEVESHGNVFALLTFLEGLALEEVSTKDLDYHDPPYELLITIRAMKPRAGLVN
jgi:SAM-dependent methyltransferase